MQPRQRTDLKPLPEGPLPLRRDQSTGDTKIDHYLGLDLLRGVAAVAVVLYHFSERVGIPGLFAHGYLAVDFFFALSGFVMARAYQQKLADGRLQIWRFYLLRLVRLLPLIVLGTIVAAVVELGRPEPGNQLHHLVDIVVALILGSALIPILFHTTLEQVIFPLNGPVWSLFLEAVANAGFAPFAKSRTLAWALIPILVASVLGITYASIAFGVDNAGPNASHFWYGFARVAWSFSVGLGLYRLRNTVPQIPILVPTMLLIAILAMPLLRNWEAPFECASIFLIMPLLVLAASAANLGPRGRHAARWSGDLSYPIYALHYPIVRAVGFLLLHKSLTERLLGVALTTIAIVGASALAYIWYDLPLRAWLGRRLPLATKRSI